MQKLTARQIAARNDRWLEAACQRLLAGWSVPVLELGAIRRAGWQALLEGKSSAAVEDAIAAKIAAVGQRTKEVPAQSPEGQDLIAKARALGL